MSNERSGGFRAAFLRSWSMSAAKLGAFALVGALVFTAVIHDAEARRMGGGRSMGKQSNTVTQQQAAAPTRAPQQAAPAGTPPSAAAQPARNRWMGPLAGIAAGLGIAALMSHLGMGGALAGMMSNLLIIAAIAFVGIWLVRKFMRRRDENTPAYASTGASPGQTGGGFPGNRYDAPPSNGYAAPQPTQAPMMGSGFSGAEAGAGAAASAAPWGVPSDFDTATFIHNAEFNFRRMQIASDQKDFVDIAEFCTPEMSAHLQQLAAADGDAESHTEVLRLKGELLGIEERDTEYLASVRFNCLMREEKGAPAQDVTEVWNFAKRKQTGDAGTRREGWLLAGIQQLN